MKIGDRVKLMDGSYSMSLVSDEIKSSCPAMDSDRTWIIVSMGCENLPTSQGCSHYLQENNCIIIDIEFSEVVYTQKRFLRFIEPKKVKLTVDGKTTYISRESAKALNLI